MAEFDPYQEPRNESFSERLTRHRETLRIAFLERMLERFSIGDRLVLYVLVGILGLSVFILLIGANTAVSVKVPVHGGSLTEGVVGPARFINPLLAISSPDKDLTQLVYSGLMRATPEGDLLPDLAQSYEISEDGTTYTFTLRGGATFHDGTPVTSQDVLFTIRQAQNPDIKSTRRADWEGVTVATPSENTIVFTLPHPYAPFLENATLGILPEHLWREISAEEFPFDPLNVHPVGSGPYVVKDLSTYSTGAATRYELESFSNFALGEPHLQYIALLFYSNEEALIDAFNSDHVDSIAGISPAAVERLTRDEVSITRVPLPRTFGVFFNQNKNTVLADIAVRAALSAGIDKTSIVNTVLRGYGVPLESPIPPGILDEAKPAKPHLFDKNSEMNETNAAERTEEARAILLRNDWDFDEEEGVWTNGDDAVLRVTLATADDPALLETMQMISTAWEDLGVVVETRVYPLSELNSTILRPRDYEAILFGEVVGRALDLFAFWHSSQRNDPGLNLALYTNASADELLAEARATTDASERERLYTRFAEIVADERPAVFLYAPEFIYFTPKNLEGVEVGALTHSAERYLNVHEWYTDTEWVWSIFTPLENADTVSRITPRVHISETSKNILALSGTLLKGFTDRSKQLSEE